jgi:hypothetical protein
VRVRHYCSSKCKKWDALATITLPVICAAAPLAEEKDFELDFLNIAVDLDTRRSMANVLDAEANGSSPTQPDTVVLETFFMSWTL